MAELDSAEKTTLKNRIDAALRDTETEYQQLRDAVGEDAADSRFGVRLATLRLISCAVRDRDVSARTRGDCDGCPEEAVRDVLETMAEQRRVSARELDDAGRVADAEREREELAVIEEFLPRPLGSDALEAAVRDVVEDLDASTLKDLGKCMTALKSRYPGQIDTRKAGKLVRRELG